MNFCRAAIASVYKDTSKQRQAAVASNRRVTAPLREFPHSQIHLALLLSFAAPDAIAGAFYNPREGTWAADASTPVRSQRAQTMGGGSGVGGFEEDTLSPHPLQQTEEAFLEGVLGGRPAPPPLQRTTSAWGEAQQLRAARRELSLVVDARLGRCVEACTQETASAAELRAALKAAAAAAAAARDADNERRQVDDRLDAALDRLGAPVEENSSDGDWVGANRLEEAISTAKAAGRAEALEALGERERLREKCELYRQRIEELENNMEDVALDDTVDAKVHNEVVARLETAEKKLRCLMGTERGKAIAQLETELEERDETIAALREALDLAARPRSPRTPPPLKPAPVDQTSSRWTSRRRRRRSRATSCAPSRAPRRCPSTPTGRRRPSNRRRPTSCGRCRSRARRTTA